FACDTCDKSYLSKRSLRNHRTYECGQPRKFVCEQCDTRFMYKHHLQRHIGRIHR
ncbi:Longitudinals lacking protein, isoforms A/B/D/L, partial [Camponotus floridanus]